LPVIGEEPDCRPAAAPEYKHADTWKYPPQAFRKFWEAAWRYAEAVKRDPLIHRAVVCAVNGLTDYLTVERKCVPEKIVWEAQRLESLLFSGYDPDFKGDEPPEL
jgi:hypothetical protein